MRLCSRAQGIGGMAVLTGLSWVRRLLLSTMPDAVRQSRPPSGHGEEETDMDRKRYVLAVLASAPQGATLSPAQLQKLFFLMDREAGHHTEGPYFNFSPYDYGPFDAGVYSTVEALERDGLATIDQSTYFREYSLTPAGHAQGQAALQQLPAEGREYASRAVNWVRSVSFNQLISAIYQRYPEMKAKSVFRG